MLENKLKQSKTSQTPDFIYFLITVYCNDYGKDKRTFDRKDFFKNCFNLPVHGILIVFEKTWPVNNMLYEAKSCTAMFKLCIAEIIWLKGKMFEVTINFFFFFFLQKHHPFLHIYLFIVFANAHISSAKGMTFTTHAHACSKICHSHKKFNERKGINW